MNKVKRSAKTTPQQFELYLQTLEEVKEFRENKFSPENPDILKLTWEALTKKLNCTGGPIRDVSGWKRIFCDWKAHVRKRARMLKVAQTETGNVGPPENPLTDLENRLLNLTGRVVVEGLDVQEIGLRDLQIPEIDANVEPPKENLLGNIPQRDEPPRKKPKKQSLLSSLQQMANNEVTGSRNSEILPVLVEINNNLNDLVQIEKNRYNLELQIAKLKYPNLVINE